MRHTDCVSCKKKVIMAKENKGQPTASNKSEGMGLITDMENQNLKKFKKMTDKYMDDDDELSDHVRKENPNRNLDKEDPTSAGPY